MDSHTLSIIISLGFLLIGSAFFSACETAFSSLNRIKLKNLAAQNNKRAASTLKIVENYDKMLSTVLIGNNIVNIASAALATVLFVSFFGSKGVSIATLVMTLLVLLLGEITPKTLAKENPEKFAMFATPLLRCLLFLLSPVNWTLSGWKKMIIKLLDIQNTQSVTEAELLTYVEEVRKEGGINEREEDMIRRTIKFDDITANDIYTPRVDVVAVEVSDSFEQIDKVFCESGYSRLPVYKDSIDNVQGMILLKDFHYALEKHSSIGSIMKPVVFITSAMKIYKILQILQDKKSHMAVLLDEFGGTVGILTIEDIVEEIVGEIWDEHDEVVESIKQVAPDTYRVLGTAHIEEMLERLPITNGDELLKEGEHGNTTISNWVFESLSGLPKEGDSFGFKNATIRVSKIYRHRVMEVVISVRDDDEVETEDKE
ncbi:membrane protein [Bacteroidia bacterium]|nr:membrane protein [Bacteroidia bacterium]